MLVYSLIILYIKSGDIHIHIIFIHINIHINIYLEPFDDPCFFLVLGAQGKKHIYVYFRVNLTGATEPPLRPWAPAVSDGESYRDPLAHRN